MKSVPYCASEIIDRVFATASMVSEDAFIIFGASIREDMEDEIRVTVIATGFEDMYKGLSEPAAEPAPAVSAAPAPEIPGEEYLEPATEETGTFPIPDFLKKGNYGI